VGVAVAVVVMIVAQVVYALLLHTHKINVSLTLPFSLNTAEAGYLLEYEKPWMRRKRIKIQKVWKKREQTVQNLVSFIKVKRQLADASKK
jgi:hypothetical protein